MAEQFAAQVRHDLGAHERHEHHATAIRDHSSVIAIMNTITHDAVAKGSRRIHRHSLADDPRPNTLKIDRDRHQNDSRNRLSAVRAEIGGKTTQQARVIRLPNTLSSSSSGSRSRIFVSGANRSSSSALARLPKERVKAMGVNAGSVFVYGVLRLSRHDGLARQRVCFCAAENSS